MNPVIAMLIGVVVMMVLVICTQECTRSHP